MDDDGEFYDEEEEDSVPYVSFVGKLDFARQMLKRLQRHLIFYPQLFLS